MCLILTTYLNSNQPHFKCSLVGDSQWLLYGMAFFWKDFKFAPGERFWRIENHGRKKLLSLYVLLFCFDFFSPKCVNQFYFLTRSFKGKEISFNKTIAFGKNREDGSVGVIQIAFNSEEYKKPISDYLASCGYKKTKKGFFASLFGK